MTDVADLDFGKLHPAYRAYIDQMLARHGIDPAGFCAPIPAADEMFFAALLPNYEQDRDIGAFKFTEATLRHFEAYDQIVRGVFGDYAHLNSVLDFASGYGRLTRVLTQKLPKDRIWAADIYAEAIAWQAKTFGINTFVSAPAPGDITHDKKHDIVFVGSLFSHLPTALFHEWLQKLYGMLGPKGVLAFSVHDETLLPAGETMDASGLSYFRTSESGSLDADIYGMSYVTEAFVADAIAKLNPGRPPAWKRFFKGLYENQDLYVVAGPEADISRLMVASPPMGGFESATLLTTGEVEFRGWAIERTPGRQIGEVSVHVDDAHVLSVKVEGERPDVLAYFQKAANMPVAWRFTLSHEQAKAGATIAVYLESGSGLRGQCFAQMPGAPVMTYSGWSRRNLRKA